MDDQQEYHRRRAEQSRAAAAKASQCYHRDLHNELADLHDEAQQRFADGDRTDDEI